jgi:hypothetical protein
MKLSELAIIKEVDNPPHPDKVPSVLTVPIRSILLTAG